MTDGDATPHPARKPLRRIGLYAPFALLVVVSLAWIAAWVYGARRVDRFADAFVAREAERGRDWLCPDRRVGGFPFRIELSCTRPQLVMRGQDGLRNEMRLGGLILHARLAAPEHVIATFTGPFTSTLRQGDGDLNWKSARASFRLGSGAIGEMSFEMLEPRLSFGFGEQRPMKAAARAVQFHLRPSPGDGAGTDFAGLVSDLAVAPLDELTGTPDPLRLEIQARAPGLLVDPARRWHAVLDEWRQRGNRARVLVLKAEKGAANIDLAGEIGLDAAHRLEGNLQGRARGLEGLTNRFARRGGLDVGGILGRLGGGGQGIPVVLAFQDGVLRYGPFPIATLAPLY
ncbi:MAG: DUF2125 domain-containing protein [Hyphomicrobiales bacterium]|nr:DUF2125 domain-containing protein [Hyphomicrobiales bacterium]MCA1999003.1 DUF2125 domain-containing protein [Hyphomicrobiales bacterium]